MKTKPRWIAAISPSKRSSHNAYNREAWTLVTVANSMHLYCPVMYWLTGVFLPVECVHHLRGKNCEALRHDKRGWLMVSLSGHGRIGLYPSEAREHGWLCPQGKWGSPFGLFELPMPGSVADLAARGILKI